MTGCEVEGTSLRSWWGPVPGSGGDASFSFGGSFTTQGLVHSFTTQDSGVERDYLGVVLVGGEDGAASCSAYVDYLRRVQIVQSYIEDLIVSEPRPEGDEWSDYVCQSIRGAAVEAFGRDGAYRAIHALLDVTGGVAETRIFRPAPLAAETTDFPGAEVLTEPGTYVARIYERSRHGAGILPVGDTSGQDSDIDPISGCAPIAIALLEELDRGRADYPDRWSLALQAGTHRYYHQYTSQDSIALDGGAPLDVGVTLPAWATAGVDGASGSATFFGQVARAPDGFPYEQILLSSQEDQIRFEPCPLLSQYVDLVWPDLIGRPDWADALGGDDDDSAQ
jgi:hypothetical protein